MKVVVLGANGQVGVETCLRLASLPGIDLVPISRTRNGSAYLRSRGVAVWHGDPTNESQARAMFKDADIVANLALASGVGKVGRIANEAIIAAAVRFSPEKAKIIFFSTLAVVGQWDADGRKSQSAYGDLKKSNERFFVRLAHQQRRPSWVLRLGHVCGSLQGISHLMQDEIRQGPIAIPDPDRASNTTYIAAICEAIIAIAQGRSNPGRYDLVNSPSWSWRQVYDYEAAQIGAAVTFDTVTPPVARRRSAKSVLFAMVNRLGIRSALDRALPLFPTTLAEQIRADFMVSRTAGEIAALTPSRSILNSAALWPALDIVPLDGVRDTATVFDIFPEKPIEPNADWALPLESTQSE